MYKKAQVTSDVRVCLLCLPWQFWAEGKPKGSFNLNASLFGSFKSDFNWKGLLGYKRLQTAAGDLLESSWQTTEAFSENIYKQVTLATEKLFFSMV